MIAAIGFGLALAVPIVLPPVLLIWYLNSGGITAALRMMKAKKALDAKRS